MTKHETLFTVPIGTNGQVICSRPQERVYVLEFTSPPDNRLNTAFCQALLTALAIVELRYPHGVLITTSGVGKFYSNGLDLEHTRSTEGFWGDSLYALWRRLLTYPMPTIALINGHCFAGAAMLAMHHDYRIMNPTRGFLCLNEVELGVPLDPPMSSIFRQKTSPQAYRALVLEGRRFQAPDALKNDIIDGLGGLDETVAFIGEFKLTTKAEKGVYGLLKREMWKESIALLETSGGADGGDLGAGLRRLQDKDRAEIERKVKEWELKAKL